MVVFLPQTQGVFVWIVQTLVTMIPDKTVADRVSALLSDAPLRPDAAESLLKDYPVDMVLSEISCLLDSSDKIVRSRAMELFCCIGDGAVPHLGVLMTDDNWIVRYRAAEALGIIGGNAACVLLLPALQDEKDHVRYMAAKGLGMSVFTKGADAVALLLEDENEFVRASAARSLGQMGLSVYVPAIEAALKQEEFEKTRIAMEEALSCLNGQ